MKLPISVALCAALAAGVAQAADREVTMHKVSAEGKQETVGVVRISETEHGLLFEPNLRGLEPGIHGFHVHEKPSCDPAEKDGDMTAAAAAGGHFDPEKAGEHEGPYGDGHLGDLPALYVDERGNAEHPVLAPRLDKVSAIADRALMVHAGGDNHSDSPEPLGGGGARVACGVIGG